MKQIDILYFDACPGWQAAVERVWQVVDEGGLRDRVVVRALPIETESEARIHRFVGSPTVRVDGQDVDPAAGALTSYGLQCRLYSHGGRVEGLPPVDLIRAALGLDSSGSPASKEERA